VIVQKKKTLPLASATAQTKPSPVPLFQVSIFLLLSILAYGVSVRMQSGSFFLLVENYHPLTAPGNCLGGRGGALGNI